VRRVLETIDVGKDVDGSTLQCRAGCWAIRCPRLAPYGDAEAARAHENIELEGQERDVVGRQKSSAKKMAPDANAARGDGGDCHAKTRDRAQYHPPRRHRGFVASAGHQNLIGSTMIRRGSGDRGRHQRCPDGQAGPATSTAKACARRSANNDGDTAVVGPMTVTMLSTTPVAAAERATAAREPQPALARGFPPDSFGPGHSGNLLQPLDGSVGACPIALRGGRNPI